jgi:hypothetical protein
MRPQAVYIAFNEQIITVDCQSAGNGDLEVFVTFRGSKVHCNLTQTQTGLYTASYLPYSCGTYHISVSFNKSEIRGRFLRMFHVSLLRQILQYQRKNTNQTVDKNFIWPYFRLTEVNVDIISSVMIW